MNPFSQQGGKNVAFFGGLKWPYLGFGVSEEVKFFLLWTLDPLGPTWGAARSEKYLHPPGTPPEVAGPEKRPNRPISTYMEQCRLTPPSTFHG